MSKIEFEVDDKKYTVGHISVQQRQEAQSVYNKTFTKALMQDGCYMQAQIIDIAKSRGLWSDEKEMELQAKNHELQSLVEKLNAGGYDVDEAKADAERARELRTDIFKSQSVIGDLSNHSAERQASLAEMDYVVCTSLKDGNGKRVCENLDDYYDKMESDLVVQVAYIKYTYGNLADYSTPEETFLAEYFPEKTDEATNTPDKVERKPFLSEGKPIVRESPTVNKQ